MTPNLLPCPFCGGEARLDQRQTQSLWNSGDATFSHVACDDCGIQGNDFCDDPSGDEAIEWWNTRANSAPANPTAKQSLTVPLEPTEAMLDVAVSFALNVSLSGEYNWSAYIRDVWQRMVKAAPAEPVIRGAVEYQQLSRWGCWDRIEKDVFDLGVLGHTPERFRALYTAPPSPDAELVELIELVRAKIRSAGRCHPNAVEYLLAEALEAIDAKLASLKGERNDDVPKPD